MAVLPGLVNGHTHLSQTFLRGLADDRPLLRWLKEVIWPAQAAMTPEDQYLAGLLGLVENLRCGVTTVVQHHKLPGRAFVDAAASAAQTVGLRMVLARGWVDLGSSGEPLESILAEFAWLHETWHGKNHDRVRVASGPLAPWRCCDDTMRGITGAGAFVEPPHAYPRGRDAGRNRPAVCTLRPAAYRVAGGPGLSGTDTQLVHAVHVTDAELDLIAAAAATVVHCPTSNLYLASGAAPVRKMLDRGIAVALGTDGSASNTSQDLLECAKIGALLANVGLVGQVRTAGLRQVDQRQPVALGDVHRPQGLVHGHRALRAALDGRVVCADQALDPVDPPDAGDEPDAQLVLGSPTRQRGELEERAVRVEQGGDPLPGEQLAAVTVPGDRLRCLLGVR